MNRSTLFVALLSLAGCSAGSSGGAAASDGGTACNNLVDDGPVVHYTVSSASPPTPTGGTILTGTYELSGLTQYPSPYGTVPSSDTLSGVIAIAGTTMQQVQTSGGQEVRNTSSFSVEGLILTTTNTCPAPYIFKNAYTATATMLLIYGTGPGSVPVEYAFRKR
jgi:hypothetical protein